MVEPIRSPKGGLNDKKQQLKHDSNEKNDLDSAFGRTVLRRTGNAQDAIFPKGQKGPAEFFTGNAYPYGLVQADSTYTTLAGNVYFEAGARSHWHSHPAGQLLIVIDGTGYHQIEGQPKEIITKGDVVKFPPNTKHWHGASKDEGMSHIYVIPNTEKGIVEWMEPVSDAQYNN